MGKTKKAEMGASLSTLIGEPIRPGQIEGGNFDPVLVSGEIVVKKLPVVRPTNVIRDINYRNDTNEALLLIDEHSAFNYSEQPDESTSGGWVFNQTSIQYFNGNSMVNLDDIITDGNLRHYKLNASAWRPSVQPSPNRDRRRIERMGLEGSLNDFCLLVGEDKNMITSGLPVQYGAILIFVPNLLGADRDIEVTLGSPSPIAIPGLNTVGGPADFTNHEFFDVCWKKEFVPSDSIWQADFSPVEFPIMAMHISFVVGTERNGTQYIPKVYKLIWDQTSAYVYDLDFEAEIADGILFGCDYDDATDTLYVVGSGFEDGAQQIFAEFSLKSNTWKNRSPKFAEDVVTYQEGDEGVLIQDGYGIRFIDNSAQFVTNNVKRGQAMWVDITDWNALSGTYPMDGGQSGIFFVQEVVSETEVVLDKRMPNSLTQQGDVDMVSPLFRWGFLTANITAVDATIVVDVPQDMVGDAGVPGTSFPAGGGTFYLEGEQITYLSSTFVDVTVPPVGPVTKLYRRYTLANCVRGVNGTTASIHLTSLWDGAPSATPYAQIRAVAVLMEFRDYRVFSKITDAKLNTRASSLYITGDNALLKRYDILPDKYVDFRKNNPLPSTTDFGKIGWKPDFESFLMTANTNSVSSVYLYNNTRLRLIDVPTTGIINSASWSPDGLSSLIGGRSLHKLTAKLNVELAEAEPKTIPIRYMFETVSVNNDDPPITVVQSDAMNIDDLDSDTLSLFVEVLPQSDEEEVGRLKGAQEDRMFELEMRIFLAGAGDKVDIIRRSWWKTVLLSDSESRYNANHFDTQSVGWVAQVDVGVYRRVFKLPEWAKYIAIDIVNKDKFQNTAGYDLWITAGVQGGQR